MRIIIVRIIIIVIKYTIIIIIVNILFLLSCFNRKTLLKLLLQ